MHVKIVIDGQMLRLIPLPSPEVIEEIREVCTFTKKGYMFSPAHKTRGWDGKICLFYRNGTAKAGLRRRITKVLKANGYKVSVKYLQEYEPKGVGEVIGLTLDDFQQKSIKASVSNRFGIISGPIRSGKTAIMGGLINRIDRYPIWVITSSQQGGIEVVTQTREAISEFIGREVGIFSEGTFTPGDIVVSSYESIRRALKYNKKKIKATTKARNDRILESVKKAKVLILDECHHSFSKKTMDILKNFESIGYKIGLSGTPKPDNSALVEMEAGIGPIVSKGSFEKLIKQGRIAKPKIFIYELPYAWYCASFSEYSDVYSSHVVENRYRNLFIADVAKQLTAKNKTVLIMTRKLDHGPNLRALIPGSALIQGNVGTEERKSLYRALQNGKLKCIISTVGKEGLNLKFLDAVINAEALSGKTTTTQKMRSLTAAEGKEFGLVIDFMDKGKYLNDHSHARLTLYKKQKGFIVKNKKVPRDYFNGREEELEG